MQHLHRFERGFVIGHTATSLTYSFSALGDYGVCGYGPNLTGKNTSLDVLGTPYHMNYFI